MAKRKTAKKRTQTPEKASVAKPKKRKAKKKSAYYFGGLSVIPVDMRVVFSAYE